MEQRDIERILERGPAIEAAPSPELLQELERKLSADLRPIAPLRPMREFGAMAGDFAVLAILGSVLLRPLALPKMGAAESVLVLSVVGMCATLVLFSLVRQMTPGSRYRVSPNALPVAVLAVLVLLFTGLFPAPTGPRFWHAGWGCFRIGTTVGAAAAGLFWFTLRRGAFMSPRVAGATAGLLAGLAGTAVLSIHCPILEWPHVLAWHLGAATVTTLAGFALAGCRLSRTLRG